MTATPTLRPDDYVTRLMAELNRAEIAMRLQKAREEAGVTQPEMADALHVHVNTIQNWESPKKATVPFKHLSEWARICGVEEEWLLHGDGLVLSADRAASIEELLRRAVGILEKLAPPDDQRQATAESV